MADGGYRISESTCHFSVNDRIDHDCIDDSSLSPNLSMETDLVSSPIATCIKYIHENIDTRITLDDLSTISGNDRFKIIRMFRMRVGITPHAYIIRLRVSRAAELLRSGEPAAEVASEVGFVDQSHLIRYFKRHFGVTPKKFVDARGNLKMIA